MKISKERLRTMSARLRYVFGLMIIAGALIAAPVVFAESGSGSGLQPTSTPANSSTSQKDSTATDDKSIDQPLSETEKTELKTRITQIKADLKIKLTDAESKKLKLKCQPAQAIVKTVEVRVATNVLARTKAYQELTGKLTDITTKLQAKGVDVTEFKQEQTVLQAKITTFSTDLAAGKQAIDDVRNVDCVSDPAAFEAALQTAQAARDKLIKDATDIRAYVTGTIKPTLEKIRAQLEAQEKSSETSSQQKEGAN